MWKVVRCSSNHSMNARKILGQTKVIQMNVIFHEHIRTAAADSAFMVSEAVLRTGVQKLLVDLLDI